MVQLSEKIQKIIQAKKKYDCYHYYCDVCLANNHLRDTHFRTHYRGFNYDLCIEHYIVICRKKGREPMMIPEWLKYWEKRNPGLKYIEPDYLPPYKEVSS